MTATDAARPEMRPPMQPPSLQGLESEAGTSAVWCGEGDPNDPLLS